MKMKMVLSSMASKRGLLSLAILSGALTLAPAASAACPDPDPGPAPAYKPARPQQNVCTAADISSFFDSLKDTNATMEDIEAALTKRNAACSSCVFSSVDDAEWGALVKDQNNPYGFFVNWAGCAELNAASSACASEQHNWNHCAINTCASCESGAEHDSCTKDVQTGKIGNCKQYDFQNSICPNWVALKAACADLPKTLNVMCAGAKTIQPDAKKDAGPSEPSDDVDSSASKPAASTKKDSSENTEDSADESSGSSESGCAQGHGASGSLASTMILLCALGGAVRKRRSRR